jgi:TPR repeat protein
MRHAAAIAVSDDDAARARRLYRQACRCGSVGACASLAQAYETGQGVPKDHEKALRYFREACAHDYWYACNNLSAYGDPAGEEGNRRHFERLCDGGKGEPSDCYWYAVRLLAGMGGAKKDFERALPLLLISCNRGFGTACYSLALQYHHGQGPLERDPVKFADLIERGCKRGSPDACSTLHLPAAETRRECARGDTGLCEIERRRQR